MTAGLPAAIWEPLCEGSPGHLRPDRWCQGRAVPGEPPGIALGQPLQLGLQKKIAILDVGVAGAGKQAHGGTFSSARVCCPACTMILQHHHIVMIVAASNDALQNQYVHCHVAIRHV